MLDYAQMIIEEYERDHDNVEIVDIREDCESISLYVSALKYVERHG